MKYVHTTGVVRKFGNFRTKFVNITAAAVLAATSLSGAAPLLLAKTAHASGEHVVVNELDTFANGNDWAELYNPTNSSISLSAYTARDADGNTKDSSKFSAATISAHGFVTVDFGNYLNKNGDTVTLSDGTQDIDVVSYGDHFVSGDEGTATAPQNASETVSRTWDGGILWTIQAQTKGASNGTAPAPTVSSCTTTSSVVTTNLNTWDLSETRATGHNALTVNGLHIWTEGATSTDKAAGYYTTNFPLSGLGNQTIAQSIDYQATTGIAPGLQLAVDFDNNGTFDGYLVGEAVYGNSWWLSGSAAQFVKDGAPHNGGGYGSSWYGTPNEWLAAFPNARVKAIGYSLGSGVHGDGIIKRISLGCTDYTFAATPPVANNITVTSNAPHGWSFVDDNGNGGSGSYVAGPSGSDGAGSAQLEVTATNQGYLFSKIGSYGATKLADILNISYKTYVQTGNNLIAPSIQLDVDRDVTDADSSWQGRLVYEPYQNGTVTDGQWQSWNATSGKWWLTKPTSFPAAACGQGSPCTFAQLAAAYPNVGLSAVAGGSLGLKAGSSWMTFKGNVDDFQFATASVNDVYNFEPDTTKPTATLTEPAANSYNPTQMVVEAHDETSLKAVTANIYDQTNTTLLKSCSQNAASALDYTLTCSVPALADGAYTIRANASDQAGHVSNTTIRQFTVDHTAPNITVKSLSSGYTPYSVGIDPVFSKVSFKLHDNVAVSKYSINGHDTNVSPNPWSDANNIVVGSHGAVYGQNTIVLYDAAGNQSTPYTFTLDNVAPDITVKPSSVGSTTANIFSKVDFKLHDQYKVSRFQVNGGAWHNLSPNVWSDANNISVGHNGGVAGTNTITLEDLAGNQATFTFTLDNVAPVVTLNGPQQNGYYTGDVDYTIAEPHIRDIIIDGTTYDEANDPEAITADGTHTIQVVDQAGNASSLLSFTIDRTKPNITVTLPGNGDFLRRTFTITGTANDDQTSVKKVLVTITKLNDDGTETVKVDDERATYDAGAGTYTFDVIRSMHLEDGNYVVKVIAVDAAGNRKAKSVHFSVDNTKPVAAITSPAAGSSVNTGDAFTVTGTASDSGSGLMNNKVTVRLVNPTTGAVVYHHKATVQADGTWQLNVPAGVTPEGTLQIVVVTEDNLGFKFKVTQDLSVVTPAAPTAPSSPSTPGGSPSSSDRSSNTSSNPQNAAGSNLVSTTATTPQVLGASTNTPAANPDNKDNGHVLGDQTSDQPSATKTIADAATKKPASLLGLAWYWWLLIALALLALLITAYRRVGTDDKKA